MKNIDEIYKKYRIMPTLADHQKTVAAVAKAIVNGIPDFPEDEKENVITACLLHDMGNMAKFDLDKVPAGLDIPDLDYWKEEQVLFIGLYGSSEKVATKRIMDLMGVSDRVKEIVSAISTSGAPKTLNTGDLSKFIAAYADKRVVPTGLVTLQGRIDDLHERYTGIWTTEHLACLDLFYEMEKVIAEKFEGDLNELRIVV